MDYGEPEKVFYAFQVSPHPMVPRSAEAIAAGLDDFRNWLIREACRTARAWMVADNGHDRTDALSPNPSQNL